MANTSDAGECNGNTPTHVIRHERFVLANSWKKECPSGGETEQRLGVGGCALGEGGGAKVEQPGKTGGRVDDESRLISLAAYRHWSEVRAVRFDQNSIQRNVSRKVTERLGILVRQHAGERQVQAHR